MHQILEVWDRSKRRAQQMAIEFVKNTRETIAISKKTWRERIKESFGRDPLVCKKCQKEMLLWRIWHPDYGEIYSLSSEQGEPIKRYEHIKENKKPVTNPQQGYQVCLSLV